MGQGTSKVKGVIIGSGCRTWQLGACEPPVGCGSSSPMITHICSQSPTPHLWSPGRSLGLSEVDPLLPSELSPSQPVGPCPARDRHSSGHQ